MLLSECFRRVREKVATDKIYVSASAQSNAMDATGKKVLPWSRWACRWSIEGALLREVPEHCFDEVVHRLTLKDCAKHQHSSLDQISLRPQGDVLDLLDEVIADFEDIERIAVEAHRHGLCLVKGSALDGSDWFDDV